MDDSEIVIVMHKKNAGEFAFTKTADDMMKKDPAIMQAFGFDNIYLKVDPDNGNEFLSKEYTSKNGEVRFKTASVYHQKPSTTTSKSNHEKWVKKVLVPYFNKYAQSKYSDAGYGSEQFEYGGDLETEKYCDYLGDFLTNSSIAGIMKEDYAYGETPLTLEDMSKDRQLIEMYFGLDKVDEGIEALLSKTNSIQNSDFELDLEPKPYESDQD